MEIFNFFNLEIFFFFIYKFKKMEDKGKKVRKRMKGSITDNELEKKNDDIIENKKDDYNNIMQMVTKNTNVNKSEKVEEKKMTENLKEKKNVEKIEKTKEKNQIEKTEDPKNEKKTEKVEKIEKNSSSEKNLKQIQNLKKENENLKALIQNLKNENKNLKSLESIPITNLTKILKKFKITLPKTPSVENLTKNLTEFFENPQKLITVQKTGTLYIEEKEKVKNSIKSDINFLKNRADEIKNLFSKKKLSKNFSKEKNLKKLKKDVLKINMFSFSNNKEKYLEIFNCMEKCYKELLKLFLEKNEKFGFEKNIFKNNFDFLKRFIEEIINEKFCDEIEEYFPKDVYNILYKENIEKLKNDLEITKNDLEKNLEELNFLKNENKEKENKINNFEKINLDLDLKNRIKIEKLENEIKILLENNKKLKNDLENSLENEKVLKKIQNSFFDLKINFEEQNKNLKKNNKINEEFERKEKKINDLKINFDFELEKKEKKIKNLNEKLKILNIQNLSINSSITNRSILSLNKKKEKIQKKKISENFSKNRIDELKELLRTYKLNLKLLEKEKMNFEKKIKDTNNKFFVVIKKLKNDVENLREEKLELTTRIRGKDLNKKIYYLEEKKYWFLILLGVLLLGIYSYFK